MKTEEIVEKATPKELKTKKVKTTKGDVEDVGSGVWRYMTRNMNVTNAQMFPLKGAKIPAKVNGTAANLLRFFDNDKAKEMGLTISDYESLNEHPELIVYEGYRVSGGGGEINIKKRESVEASFLDQKIKQGEITELGVVIPKTGAQKWLGRIGKFMAMGGFLIVLFVIVGLVIAISILSQRC